MENIITILPSDLIFQILSFLTREDIVKFRLLCKQSHDLIENEELWKILCIRDKYNTHKLTPHKDVGFKQFYLQFEDKIGVNECIWFLKFNLDKLKWELNKEALKIISSIPEKRQVAVVTAIDLCPSNTTASTLLNTLLGFEDSKNGFPKHCDSLCIKMWGKPLIHGTGDIDVIFLQAYGLFDDEDEHTHHLRKSLMGLVMLLSSTVIICKTSSINFNWVSKLDELVDVVQFPPLFACQHTMRSLLVCTKMIPSPKKCTARAYDVYREISMNYSPKEVRDTSELERYPFISCVVNWFGNAHGMEYGSPNEQVSRDVLLTFLYNLNNPVKFGWPLSRWQRLRTTGKTCVRYMEHCATEASLNVYTSVNVYDKIIAKFGRSYLDEEMIRATQFYTKATSAELDPYNPLEMSDLVQRSEMHTINALRTFTQSIGEALFPHQLVGEVEMHLKAGINNNFRPIWRANGQMSENYCQKIFDSCFKWVKAEVDCPSKPSTEFKERFKTNFYESLDVYLSSAKGTRKCQVMSFCSKQYIDMITKLYPDLKQECHQILVYVEQKTIQETLLIDEQRSYLQKVGAMKMKLQTIENTIHRLSEEIQARKIQAKKSEEWFELRENKLERLGLSLPKNQNQLWSNIRSRFIASAEKALKQEEIQFREFEQQLQQITNKSTKEIKKSLV